MRSLSRPPTSMHADRCPFVAFPSRRYTATQLLFLSLHRHAHTNAETQSHASDQPGRRWLGFHCNSGPALLCGRVQSDRRVAHKRFPLCSGPISAPLGGSDESCPPGRRIAMQLPMLLFIPAAVPRPGRTCAFPVGRIPPLRFVPQRPHYADGRLGLRVPLRRAPGNAHSPPHLRATGGEREMSRFHALAGWARLQGARRRANARAAELCLAHMAGALPRASPRPDRSRPAERTKVPLVLLLIGARCPSPRLPFRLPFWIFVPPLSPAVISLAIHVSWRRDKGTPPRAWLSIAIVQKSRFQGLILQTFASCNDT